MRTYFVRAQGEDLEVLQIANELEGLRVRKLDTKRVEICVDLEGLDDQLKVLAPLLSRCRDYGVEDINLWMLAEFDRGLAEINEYLSTEALKVACEIGMGICWSVYLSDD